MKVLIVAKTRRGGGACIGGIAEDGRSVRLLAADSSTHGHAGLEYEIGDIWEVQSRPDLQLIPPHIENIIVLQALRLRRSEKVLESIRRFMPPVFGGPESLFEGRTQVTPSGGLYIAERTSLPSRSTMFWTPNQPLQLDCEGKRIRYRYPTSDGGRSITFVGFQEPLPEIPAGTLLRVSLAHWWRPDDRPEEELRCFVQLSGWFLEPETEARVRAEKQIQREIFQNAEQPANRKGSVREILQTIFGFTSFLPLQNEVIARVLDRKDTLAIMPTGSGKSICYQVPALQFDGLTVVISPLVALMQDQVHHLRELNIPAACLNHMVPLHQYTTIANQVRHGIIKILYLAPETLLRPETLLLLEQSKLACLAVDEAHCISEWGHDFRPEYRQVEKVRRRFPRAVCLALTATATQRVRDDIRRLVGIPAEGVFLAGFNRKNLFLTVERRPDTLGQVLGFLKKRRGQSGIIYCGKRKQADELAASLAANNWPALPYHAGMEDDFRKENQERFMRGEMPLMVATIAFGMGIDKPDVRFVVHVHLPKDVESYYQEIGRAGRDNLPADCLLLHSYSDVMIHRHFIEQGAESQRAGRHTRLKAMLRFAETRSCRRKPLLEYFGETFAGSCDACDNCAGSYAQSLDSIPVEIVRRTKRHRFHEIGELFQSGQSVDAIARRFEILPRTVLTNLHLFHEDGGQLDPQRILSLSCLGEPLKARAVDAFGRLGLERLSPVHQELSGAVDYEQLSILRLYLLCRQRAVQR